MDLIATINILLAPLGSIILLIVDYTINRSTDRVQRRIVISCLISALLAIVFEIIYEAFKGRADAAVIVYSSNYFYFLFQVTALNLITLFLDYNIHQSITRLKKLTVCIGGIIFVSAIVLAINLFNGFIYSFTPDNVYLRGEWYALHMIICYVAMIVIIIDLVLSWDKLPRHVLALFIIFASPFIIGSSLDFVIPGARLAWPSFWISLLFAYLFIVRADYRIDSLTGIYNRRYCDEYIATFAKTHKKSPISFFMIDVNRFKEINDIYGHPRGDQALRDIAAILRDSVRQSDFVGRYGGDEFIIVSQTDKAEALVERINQNTSAFNDSGLREYKLSLSIGYDIFSPNETKTVSEFITHVDTLMYQNKRERRGA